MKTRFCLVIVLCLILLNSCTKEKSFSPSIDFPAEMTVSKGSYVDRINITWDAPPKSKFFEVYRADSITNEYQLIAKTEASSYADTSNHIADKKYYYKVRVYNSEEEFSDFTHYDYGYVSKFLAPKIDHSPLFGTENNYISLKWDSVKGSSMYYILRSSNNIDFNLLDSTHLFTYTDNRNLIAGKTFYYKIKAFNKLVGFSELSKPDSGYIYQDYSLKRSFGNFTLASYIDFDSKSNIYIVDATAGKVKMYDKDYNFIKDFISVPGTTFRGIKFIQDDNVILAESNKGMIGFFDSNGNLLKEKTVANTVVLRQVTTDHLNNIYLTDLGNVEVVKLNSNGDFISKWKSSYIEETFGAYSIFFYNNSLMLSSVNGNIVGFSDLNGQFLRSWNGIGAACISMDKESNFYFACFSRIIKTDSKGKILSILGKGDLKQAQTVSVNANGDVLVTDENNPSKVFIYQLQQ